MIDRIKSEIDYMLSEELDGLLWVLCAIVIPFSLVFITAYMDGAL
jgi:hypothetical protein